MGSSRRYIGAPEPVELQDIPGSPESRQVLMELQGEHAEWVDPASEQLNAVYVGKQLSGLPEQLNENSAIVTIRSILLLQRSFLRDIAFSTLCLASGGTVALFCYWNNSSYARLRFNKAVDPGRTASHVLVESLDGLFTVCPIETASLSGAEHGASWMKAKPLYGLSSKPAGNRTAPRTFVWRNERFWQKLGSWHRQRLSLKRNYVDLQKLAARNAIQDTKGRGQGTTVCSSEAQRWLTYGDNVLTVVVTPFIILLVLEFFKPFFVFQALAILIWFIQQYVVYAYVILALTISSALFNAFESWRNLRAIQKLASSECTVTRVTAQNNSPGNSPQMVSERIKSSQLMPGDLIEVLPGMIFPCDCILLTGQAVINESMLTGESAPVLKSSLPLDAPEQDRGQYDPALERNSKFRLLSGTKVVQVKRPLGPPSASVNTKVGLSSVWDFDLPTDKHGKKRMPVLALVAATAYNTAKGQLVRAILFPKQAKLDFEKKMYYFMFNLLLYLLAAIIATIVIQRKTNTTGWIVVNCLNLVTIAIPPALPLALSIGLSVSFTRLQTKKIFCINPPRIVNAGRVNTACFDKTGTLTEDGLSLRGVCAVQRANAGSALALSDIQADVQKLYLEAHQACSDSQSSSVSASRLALSHILAACHGLSLLEQAAEDAPEEDLGKGRPGPRRSWRALLGWESALAFHRHHDQVQPESVALEERSGPAAPSFVGDPLEVQMFAQTGWTYSGRPEEPPVRPHETSSFPVQPYSVWSHPSLPPSCDTVLIPPPEEDGSGRAALAVLRRFDFDNEIRMMSVLVLELPPGQMAGDQRKVALLAKGAPESIKERCIPASVPVDFESQLQSLALNGDRVLACAYRAFPSTASTRDPLLRSPRPEMETGLTFAGFLVMENKLKPETAGVLQKLTAAGLRQVMVTGDNPLTAVAVARKCGPFFLRPSRRTFLLDHVGDAATSSGSGCVLKDVETQRTLDFDHHCASTGESDLEQGGATAAAGVDLVVTGRAFQALQKQHKESGKDGPTAGPAGGSSLLHSGTSRGDAPNVSPFESVLTRANIFARMSPQNKVDLISALMDLGYTVCMTGDGANDSMALKAADVGISIASKEVEEEDSVNAAPSIAAPFSTKLAHIGAVPIVLAEGRSAMVTASSMFKYMFTYGLIQTTSVIVLYRLQLELYQYMYLWADLALVFPMVVLIPALLPRQDLTPGRPESDLLARSVLISVYGHSAILIGFQALASAYLHSQSWYYQPLPNTAGFNTQFNQNTTESWLFSTFQYIFLAWTFAQSFRKFRAPLVTNLPLCLTLGLQLLLCSIFMLAPTPGIRRAFNMVDLSAHRGFLFGLWFLALLNGAAHLLFERFAVLHQSSEPDPVDPQPILHELRVQQREAGRVKSGAAARAEGCWTDGGHCIPSKVKMARYHIVSCQTSSIWAALQ